MKRLVFAFSLPAAFGLATFGLVSCVPDPGVLLVDGAAPESGNTGSGNRAGGTGGSPIAARSGGAGGVVVGGSGGRTGGGGVAAASGGAPGTGGNAGRGSGGTGGTAGRGTGGAVVSTGGNAGRGTGGSVVVGTGGRGTGGVTGTGGAGTGGSVPTSCNLTNHSGSGSFTHYYFSQGTAPDGNGYRTACGYFGTEGGSSASGPNDSVQNIATASPAGTTYFAAIPGQNGFDSKANCGACVQITGQTGKTIIATIVDECPYGSDGGNAVCGNNASGHLDLSTAAFDAVGPFTNGQGATIGNPTNTTWRFVPCPVSGNVKIRVKSGNPNEIFVENSILAVTRVELNGAVATHQSYGAWHFGSNLMVGQSLRLTDTLGRVITVTVSSTSQNLNQDTGQQFPSCQ